MEPALRSFPSMDGSVGGTPFLTAAPHTLGRGWGETLESDLMMLQSLAKRLENHAPSKDVSEGDVADWTIEQLLNPAQRSNSNRVHDLLASYAVSYP